MEAARTTFCEVATATALTRSTGGPMRNSQFPATRCGLGANGTTLLSGLTTKAAAVEARRKRLALPWFAPRLPLLLPRPLLLMPVTLLRLATTMMLMTPVTAHGMPAGALDQAES